MVIEELRSIVGMEFADEEGQPGQNALKGIVHDQVAATQHRHPLTPAGGHDHHLQGVHVFPSRAGAAMVDEVHLEVAELSLIPGDASHGNVTGQTVAGLGLRARQARLILTKTFEDTLDDCTSTWRACRQQPGACSSPSNRSSASWGRACRRRRTITRLGGPTTISPASRPELGWPQAGGQRIWRIISPNGRWCSYGCEAWVCRFDRRSPSPGWGKTPLSASLVTEGNIPKCRTCTCIRCRNGS